MTDVAEHLGVEVDAATRVSMRLLAPPRGSVCLVLAHGAGNDMEAPLLVHLQQRVAAAGFACARFNFPYKEAGRKAPDAQPRLLATWRAVLAVLRERLGAARLCVGGKSMGGRMASLVVADGEAADGLVFLGYPLHAAGRRDRLRDAHFGDIAVPSLFIQGDRDSLCDLALLRAALPRLGGPASLHVVEAGDHSFRVTKSSGRDAAEVQAEIDDALLGWLRSR